MVKTSVVGKVDGKEFVLINEERFSLTPEKEGEKSEFELKKSIMDNTIAQMTAQIKGSKVFTLDTDEKILKEAARQMNTPVPTVAEWKKFSVMSVANQIKAQAKQMPPERAKKQIEDMKEDLEHLKRTVKAMVIK